MKKIKILLIFVFIILVLIFLSQKSKKEEIPVLEPYVFSKEYSSFLLENLEKLGIKEVKLNQTVKLDQVGSFVDENSPYYFTLEDYQVGESLDLPIGKFKAKEGNKIIYLKFKVFKEKREGKNWLIVDLINYRIIGRFCNSIKKICYEVGDAQEPKIGSKKEVDLKTYYLFSAVPKDEKIDTIVFEHLSFSGAGFPPLVPSQTNELPLVKFTP